MFIDYTSDFSRTISVLRDACKKLYVNKWNNETKQLEIDRNYEEVDINSHRLIKTPAENDPEHQQGYFAIDAKNKKIIIRVTDDYFLKLTFELEDQDRVDYPEQFEIDENVEYKLNAPAAHTVYSVKKVAQAHAVVNRKLVHYRLRGYNGDWDLIEDYPCRCTEQKHYTIKRKVGHSLETQTCTFTELSWKQQVSYIIRDINAAVKMRLKDWERKSEKDDYDRKYL